MDAFLRGLLFVGALSSLGASYRTPNFVINAPTAEFAEQVGEAAEIYRRELAIDWTGKPLPGNWEHPCPVTVIVGDIGAGGKTTFNFANGQVYGWKMEIQGSKQRILDSVLPHEINHTIFASHFRRPLPRWADEGAASLIEHDSERNRLRDIHTRVMGTRRKIGLQALLEMKQYPQDHQDVLALYAEGHSLADYLIQRGGKPRYIQLMALAHDRSWEASIKQLYGFQNLQSLEREWDQWVIAGSPTLKVPDGSQVAVKDKTQTGSPTIRGQSPEGIAQLGDPVDVIPIPNSGAQEASTTAARRSRGTIQEPLLTIDGQTTNAAKVSQN